MALLSSYTPSPLLWKISYKLWSVISPPLRQDPSWSLEHLVLTGLSLVLDFSSLRHVEGRLDTSLVEMRCEALVLEGFLWRAQSRPGDVNHIGVIGTPRQKDMRQTPFARRNWSSRSASCQTSLSWPSSWVLDDCSILRPWTRVGCSSAIGAKDPTQTATFRLVKGRVCDDMVSEMNTHSSVNR